MRKRLIASVFITFLLCAPTLAGHVLVGTGWCPCGTEACICDPGEVPMPGSQLSNPEVSDKSTQETPVGLGSETLFVLAALILVLRYKV